MIDSLYAWKLTRSVHFTLKNIDNARIVSGIELVYYRGEKGLHLCPNQLAKRLFKNSRLPAEIQPF
ncbi:uncharacterized protein PHALS_15226 [Plasmopara halstedii]|uniref:Uncharacterized protein n=1 Tax=Plasmopara halstedii TaxID=4781 RepID=A0A0P1B4A6_PLAHL|nr:uncharacterized protein PHALS_15226 [Plasmopara halstedii]CEG49613.1 hypothetical protein PHALS_15226 [Plasmopara halstedii]|eukprot:XP_024585982.1 hypothetical protein PHALS_15226 [Plasmopara halstedii]